MPDRLQKLQSAIRDLEAELHAKQPLDESSRRMLEEALVDIQTALRDPTRPNLDSIRNVPGPVNSRLRDMMREFEQTHPNLTGILARLIDSLAQMGI